MTFECRLANFIQWTNNGIPLIGDDCSEVRGDNVLVIQELRAVARDEYLRYFACGSEAVKKYPGRRWMQCSLRLLDRDKRHARRGLRISLKQCDKNAERP